MAIVFGLETPTFLAKSRIFIPKCTEEWGIVPKKHQFFYCFSWVVCAFHNVSLQLPSIEIIVETPD